MKKSLFFIVLLPVFLIVFTSCECDEPSDQVNNTSSQSFNIEKEKATISELLDQLATATESGNLEMIEKIWCPKDHTLLIGTESSEKLEGWAQIKEAIGGQSDSFSETLISITDQNIWLSDDGKTAWFYEELNYNFIINDKAMSFEGIRFTGVFVKNVEFGWKLVQGHLSVSSHIEAE